MLTYKRKLILNKSQEERLSSWIGVCRLVYNMGLEIRMEAYKNLQQRVSKFDLMNQLPTIKDIDWIKDVPAQSLQSAIERLDISYENFFRTCYSGGGFPKFASKKKYKSIKFKNSKEREYIKIIGNRVKLPKIGQLKMFKDAPILGILKTATVVKEPNGYFICIVCDNIKNIQNKDENQVCGIDMGLSYFCADSDGNIVENLKLFKQNERKISIESKSLSRKKRNSNRWKKQVKRIAVFHGKIANTRRDFLHKESTKIAKKYHTVYLEDLNIKNMGMNKNFSKQIFDCGWGIFRTMLEYKTNVIRVNPKHTSQTCNKCGCIDSKNRISQSCFECVECGHIDNADINASKNIMSKGIALNRKREPLGCALVE